ncbi:flagellar basal body-associated FliL family protein, partial [bacterium]|nr:flagellar basal body-associated FliL family protein [bacterium]
DVAALFQQLNFPIRNALLKVLASQREEMIARINFREDLAFELKKEINDILETKTGSREVLELYFAELIVQ